MENTDLYGISIGGVLLSLIFFAFFCALTQKAYSTTRLFFLRNVYYPLLPRWIGGGLRLSRYHGFLICVFAIANICFISIGVADSLDLARRLGQAALINLIPLGMGARIHWVADLLSLRTHTYQTIHICIGTIFIIEVLLHSILFWSKGNFNLGLRDHVAGLTAFGSVAAIALTSIPILWQWMYELLSALHTIFTIACISCLWFHLTPSHLFQKPGLYLYLAILVFVMVKLTRLANIAFTNFSTRASSTAIIQDRGRIGIEVRVSLPRPLKHQAGQYVFLSIPRLAPFQFHPFQIAWDYLGDNGEHVLVFLIKPRHGFSRRMVLADPFRNYMSFIEGPYGNSFSLDQYGTVLLFARGIGIAGQLPYMKEQLRLYQQWRTKTRRYAVFWEMDDEAYRYLVRDWMDELLSWDIEYDMQLYIQDHFVSQAEAGDITKQGKKKFRITLNYTPIQLDEVIRSEIGRNNGRRMLISVCTDSSMAQTIADIARPLLSKDVDLVELDFNPWVKS